MTVHEQSDGLIPNKQTPPASKQLGTSADKWDEVNVVTVNATTVAATTTTATTASGTNVGAGTAMYIGGTAVARTQLVADNIEASGKFVTHAVGTQYPVVQVYDSGGSGIPLGSGSDDGTAGAYHIVRMEVLSATQFVLVPNGAVSGAQIRIVG